ncbi:hypothetical protein F4803DRAFT_526827 [Xylaria telfairii]|nr:hypothetical protein F4803DRAFT_526827 [Xylaria telfairii]
MPLPIWNPTYLLAPNFTFRPGGPISLGNIITNPFKPHIVLSRPVQNGRLPETETAQERDWELTVGSARNLNANLWFTFLEGVGIKVAAKHDNQQYTTYTTQTLETVYFKNGVTADLMNERMKDPSVAELMKPNRFLSKPVYMITGIKIAKGFQLSSDGVIGNQCHSGVAGPASGPIGAAGVEAGITGEKSTRYKFKSDNEVVFAYQLLKISPKGWRRGRPPKLAEYKSSATMLGAGGDDRDVTPEFEASYFSTMDQDDIKSRPVEVTVNSTKDKDGNPINIISWSNEQRTQIPKAQGTENDIDSAGNK